MPRWCIARIARILECYLAAWYLSLFINKTATFAPAGDYLSSRRLQSGLDDRNVDQPTLFYADITPSFVGNRRNVCIINTIVWSSTFLKSWRTSQPWQYPTRPIGGKTVKTEKLVLAFGVTHHFCLMNYPSSRSSFLKVLLRGSTTPLTLIPFKHRPGPNQPA